MPALIRSLSLLGALAFALPAPAKPGFPKATQATRHFVLSIDEKKAHLLPSLGAMAEGIHARQKAFFEHEPKGPIRMAFLDEDDYSNGFAYAAKGWVVVYLHGSKLRLRGISRWLPNVTAHELGHVFTLAEMGETSTFQGVDLFHDWRGASGTHLHESFGYRHRDVPPWLAEGLAQLAAQICGHDTLDTDRRMVLRTAAAEGKLLSLAEMKAFGWDGRRNELIYQQGYSLVAYLHETFGHAAFVGFLQASRLSGWRDACRKTFGKSIADIYAAWRLREEQGARADSAAATDTAVLGPLPRPYLVEASPTPMAGGHLLFLSSSRNDYGGTDLFLLRRGRRRPVHVFDDASSISPHPGGITALFTATRYYGAQAGEISDLYSVHGHSGHVRRLTTRARITRGCHGPGDAVFALRQDEGRTVVVRLQAGGRWSLFYQPPDSLELLDLRPGRGDSTLCLTATSGRGGDLYELNLADSTLRPLAVTANDERDGTWRGDTLVFSADYSGVFDIHALHGDSLARLTRVPAGAFQPSLADSILYYAAYGPEGFRLRSTPWNPVASIPAPSGMHSASVDTAGLPDSGGVALDSARPAPSLSDTAAQPASAASNTTQAPGPQPAAPPPQPLAIPAAPPQPPAVAAPPLAARQHPRPAEKPGQTDHGTGFGLVAYGLRLGAVRFPGAAGMTASGADTFQYAFSSGQKAIAGVEASWSDPVGTVELDLGVGYAFPLDYEGASHLDDSHLELRLAMLRPTIVLGADWYAYDLPGYRENGTSYRARSSTLYGYDGLDWRIGKRWALGAWLLWKVPFRFLDEDLYGDARPSAGAKAELTYWNLDYGLDALTHGFAWTVRAAAIPDRDGPIPALHFGFEQHESFRRVFYLSVGTEVDQQLGNDAKLQILGALEGRFRVPLGWNLGTRQGRGVYFHSLMPGAALISLLRADPAESGGSGFRPPSGQARPAHRPPGVGFAYPLFPLPGDGSGGADLFEPFVIVKTLALFPRPAYWRFGASFYLARLERGPIWRVQLSL